MTNTSAAATHCILQVVLSLSPGGTERLVIEIARRLLPRFNMVVCCLDEPGAWAQELIDAGVEVTAFHRRPGFHPSLSYRIAEVAARHRATVLHCHHYSPFVYGQVATFLNRRLRIVFTEHGRLSDAPPSRKRRLMGPILGRLSGDFYTVSEDLKRHLMVQGFPSDRIRVIYNGIDPGEPATMKDRERARRLLGLPEQTFLVGTVARLDAVKDLDTLIEAFSVLRSEASGSELGPELVVVGDGPERPRLETKVRQIGLGAAVHFTGHRQDIRALLPAFDAYVNSSTSEGVSLTILEAMAASLPVVATRVGGTPEVVIDDHTGLLVPARTPSALTRAMAALAGAPERRRVFGAAGRSRIERHFTVDRMVDDYARAYADVGAF